MVKMKLMEHAEKEQKMERLNTVLRHPLYQQYYKELREEERDRIFCCHQMEHLLDVARIAYIRNLENNLGYSKELLYTTAILHDIGKALQYKEKFRTRLPERRLQRKFWIHCQRQSPIRKKKKRNFDSHPWASQGTKRYDKVGKTFIRK